MRVLDFEYKKIQLRTVVTGLIMSSVILFIALSLFTFNRYDYSWFYFTTKDYSISNRGGFWGAQCAAVFFYFFGGAALLVPFFLMLLAYIRIMRISIKYEWERIAAGIILIVFYAALLHHYGIDIKSSPYSGGLVG